ncbi:Uncharacterised protein [Vibrio cholerae]|uniref:Uncharacterized protein n=1 Tax=Vibrio cholerae TaxID=666 RepID=A0A656AGX7_VIBCL|nr:Uncharacterised protein [Vibrio cholerae]CSC07409.1 Uncharacterised protein [Vibrio cholerae]CSD10420.1 Uncharacterised protein [Vibrio cholerae]
MAQYVIPAAVEVISHCEDIIHVLNGLAIVHIFNLVMTNTDSRRQFIFTTRFRFKLIKHSAQFCHQGYVSWAIFYRIAKISRLTAAARVFPVNIHAIVEFPCFQETFHRSDKHIALRFIGKAEEGIRECPATDRWDDFQIRIGFFQRHQHGVVTFDR